MSKRPIEATEVGGGPETMPLDSGALPVGALPAAHIDSASDLPIVDREHYEVISEYARGGLGRIIRARDRRTGRIVAIKEMLGHNDDAARRFAREALITANLQHPSIVPVYELGRWATGEPFYAMKLVAGSSFEDVIKATTSLDERLARLPIVVSIAEAIAYAHGRRIIHRDLKPANVLVGDLGETVVIDWGLAKRIEDAEAPSIESTVDDNPIVVPETIAPLHTRVGAVMGTPQYMSPEQARGEPVDERADVYQIGAMLYHLISGATPYAGHGVRTSKDLIALVAGGAPRSLISREPAVPPDLQTIVDKAMARAPQDRYANAGELTADLRRFTTGQLVSAHRYARRTLFARWLRRNRAAVTVGGVLVSVLAGVAIWSVCSIIAERDNVAAQRDIARQQTARAEEELATALYEKGRVAEAAQEWGRAAMYYATARVHHDSPASAWAAGLAESRAVLPVARHQGHAVWVHAVAIAPEGDRVATVDDAGVLRVWSPTDGHLLATRSLARGALYAVAFAPDGKELAIAGNDGVIERLSPALLTTGTLPGHTGRVWSLAYSPDGATLASGGEDGKVKLWTLRDGAARQLDGHTQRVYSVAFSPDGKRLASGSDDRRLWVWDVATGVGHQRGEHKAGGIKVVAFAPSGDPIVTTGWDHEIRVWKGEDQAADLWSESGVVHGAAISPSGVLVTGGDLSAIHAWEPSTHRLVSSLEAPDGQISAIAFSRDGKLLVTAGKAAPIAWDATALGRIAGVGHGAEVVGLAFSRDGARFASGANDRTLRLWDTASARELQRVSTAALSCGDGALVLGDDELASSCDDGTLRRWDPSGHQRVLPTSGWLRLTALSPDATILAAGYAQGRVALVDVARWELRTQAVLHAHQVYGVQYARDGRLVTASLDDHVRISDGDLTSKLDVRVNTDDGVLAAALSADGTQLAIGSQDGSLHIWDVPGARWRIRDAGAGKLGTVWKLAFSPDGAHLFTATDDGLVRIWSSATWTGPVPLDAGEGAALGLAVSPDGRTLLAGYKSGAIVIWDISTRTIRQRIGGRIRDHGSCADVSTLTWSDDAQRDLVAAACSASAPNYLERMSRQSHQKVVGAIDVTWDWF